MKTFIKGYGISLQCGIHGMIGVIQPNDLKQLEQFGNTLKNRNRDLLQKKPLTKRDKWFEVKKFARLKRMKSFLKFSGINTVSFLPLMHSLKKRWLSYPWIISSPFFLRKLKKGKKHVRLMEKKVHLWNTTILIRRRKRVSKDKTWYLKRNMDVVISHIKGDDCSVPCSRKSSLFDITLNDER